MKRRLNNGSNLRLDDSSLKSLENLAARYGITKSDLMRNAIREVLPKWEREGIRLSPSNNL